jgi:hypothetical protein
MGKDAKFIVRLEAVERQQLQALVDEGRSRFDSGRECC